MTQPRQTDRELVDRLEQVWQSIHALCTGLSDAEWKTPTECPGWSVQDNVAHVTGIESAILGRPEPEHTAPEGEHVRNDVGRRNEVWVDSRRARSGPEVLAEFREVTQARVVALRSMSADDFGAESWTPVGPGTVRDLLPFRVFDCWVHEQDMRRALGRPGGFDADAARDGIGRVAAVMPMVVGKKVKPADGTTVVFDVTGPAGRSLAVAMQDGRAQLVDALPVDSGRADPTVRLTMDSETFLRLGAGRGDPAAILATGAVSIAGDHELGEAIVAQMNFLF
jgi:uncharacterized protein (TIGR03083 family)